MKISIFKRFIIVVICLSTLIFIASFQSTQSFRRNIEHLKDSLASKIDIKYPKDVSIYNINKIKKEVKESTPRIEDEFNVYKINCNVRGYKREINGDYVLNLVEDADTISAKIINADINDSYLKYFIPVRTNFESCILPDYKVKNGYYKVIGVGFYGKSGRLEINPIIYFQKFK